MPPARAFAGQVANAARRDGIEIVRRLVDEQHARVSQQRPGKDEPLLHPVRERARPAVADVSETDRLQQLE